MNHYVLFNLRCLVFPEYYAGIVINEVKGSMDFSGEDISTKFLSVEVETGKDIELTVLKKMSTLIWLQPK